VTDAVQLLQDREDIAEVIRTYARAVDQRDFATVESCFAPDLHVVDWWGQRDMDRDQTMAYIAGVAIFRSTMHMMGNQVIHVDGDEATVLTRALLTHTSDGTHQLHEHSEIYTERLVRRAGRWVIVERGGAEALGGPGVTGVATDDPAVQWLLDRAAVADRIAALGFGDEPRFVGRVLIDPNEDRGSFTALPATTPMPAEVEPQVVHWGEGEVTLPARPTSTDPRIRRLLLLSELRDRSTLRSAATTLTGNQRVTVADGGAAATVETYAYAPPAWGRHPEVWRDRYADGVFVERVVTDNVMPDERMRRS
jgi:ketosteroid isomerase-like protein